MLAPLSVSPVPVLRCRSCNCKNSKCLKLYCECFAAGIYCDECNCKHCHNNVAHEAERKQAIEVTLERNPRAFRPKIAVTATASPKHNNHTTAASSASGGDSQSLGLSVSLSHYKGADSGRSAAASADEQSLLLLDDPSLGYYDSVTAVRQVHHKGCHCKKSFCLKKYCEVSQSNQTASIQPTNQPASLTATHHKPHAAVLRSSVSSPLSLLLSLCCARVMQCFQAGIVCSENCRVSARYTATSRRCSSRAVTMWFTYRYCCAHPSVLSLRCCCVGSV